MTFVQILAVAGWPGNEMVLIPKSRTNIIFPNDAGLIVKMKTVAGRLEGGLASLWRNC